MSGNVNTPKGNVSSGRLSVRVIVGEMGDGVAEDDFTCIPLVDKAFACCVRFVDQLGLRANSITVTVSSPYALALEA